MMQIPKAAETIGIFEQRVTHMLQLRTLIGTIGRIGDSLIQAVSPILQSSGEVSAWLGKLI